MTISRTWVANYFVCSFIELEIQQFPKSNKAIGIDFRINDIAITTDGKKFKNNRYTNTYATQLKRARQHLSVLALKSVMRVDGYIKI